MPGNLPRPEMWKSLNFGDKDAFLDFCGAHGLWHAALDKVVRAAGGAPFPSLSLGDGPIGEQGDWHLIHQAMHVGEASGLALSGPPDFTAYDLNRRDDFTTWSWTHALESIRLQLAAGI